MDPSKAFQRPPFANYDLVVYFGCGLFCIPFINRYLVVPTDLRWPQFEVSMSSDVASQIVAGLALLFTIYIIGHILAYLASLFVEKGINSVLGKVSSAIILSSTASEYVRDEAIRALVFSRTKSIFTDRFGPATIIRVAFHLPAIPIYIASFALGTFGYFQTRIPSQIMGLARARMRDLDWNGLRISLKSKWYKALEYYVINYDQPATLRMYNYLVIGGLFRSLAFLFLATNWLQIYYILHLWIDGDAFIRPLFSSNPMISLAVEFCIANIVYIFCLFSFVKFQRRYAEEAIFAFAFKRYEV